MRGGIFHCLSPTLWCGKGSQCVLFLWSHLCKERKCRFLYLSSDTKLFTGLTLEVEWYWRAVNISSVIWLSHIHSVTPNLHCYKSSTLQMDCLRCAGAAENVAPLGSQHGGEAESCTKQGNSSGCFWTWCRMIFLPCVPKLKVVPAMAYRLWTGKCHLQCGSDYFPGEPCFP